MNWVRIVVVALASGLAMGLVELLFRGRARRGAYWITAVGLLALTNVLMQLVILPEVESRQAMQSLPVLVALERVDPAAAERIRSFLQDGLRNRAQMTESQARMRSALTGAVKKHGPRASDEALLLLTEVSVDAGDSLKSNPEMCVELFYPSGGRFVDYSTILSKSIADREMKAMEAIFRTAAANPQRPVPKESDVAGPISSVVASLVSRGFKEDVFDAMQNPRGSKVDRGQLCDATIAMFQEILAMPPGDRGAVLRFMVAAE
jgi:hypothetical protein